MPGKDMWRIYGPVLVIALIGFIAALMLMAPAPPKKIRFGAGAISISAAMKPISAMTSTGP